MHTATITFAIATTDLAVANSQAERGALFAWHEIWHPRLNDLADQITGGPSGVGIVSKHGPLLQPA